MPRYVILRHETPEGATRPSHWDWMFEEEGALATWALEELPLSEKRAATALAPHRLAYLDYEGPISGGRGEVTRWDEGVYEGTLPEHSATTLKLRGRRLDGELTIQPSRIGASASAESWVFSWNPSDSAGGRA